MKKLEMRGLAPWPLVPLVSQIAVVLNSGYLVFSSDSREDKVVSVVFLLIFMLFSLDRTLIAMLTAIPSYRRIYLLTVGMFLLVTYAAFSYHFVGLGTSVSIVWLGFSFFYTRKTYGRNNDALV
ncbi:hypothetical protein [Vibrio sp. TBV020]|uniref:hypothetical protein n=1 Tax=Vibrio sp. TBV020 TaxID=3137398 RepID=UPI0038CDB4EF